MQASLNTLDQQVSTAEADFASHRLVKFDEDMKQLNADLANSEVLFRYYMIASVWGTVFCNTVFYILGVKYWIIARKLESILVKSNIQNLECQAKLILGALILLSLYCLQVYISIDMQKWFLHATSALWYTKSTAVVLSFMVWTNVFFLVSTYRIFRKFDET